MNKYLIFDSRNDGVLFLPLGTGVVPQYISSTEVRIHIMPGSAYGATCATITGTGLTQGFVGNIISAIQRLVDEPDLKYVQPTVPSDVTLSDWTI
tara:strand:- start:39 stop:323 length:285 start_codon:yes stop_codon:yes gene_type:complete